MLIFRSSWFLTKDQPTTPTDLLVGAFTGGLGNLIKPAWNAFQGFRFGLKGIPATGGRSGWWMTPAGKTYNRDDYYTPNTPGLQRAVNPEGGQMNCALCTISADAALAGRAAQSVPGADAVIETSHFAHFMGGTWRSRNGVTGVVGDLKRWGNGSRAAVMGWRGDREIGHYFNVINDDGRIAFIDAQQGTVAGHLQYWDSFLIMRLGNL